MKKQKNKKLEAGITLIALVVTIIVLIILAGVSIAMLVGENGIITQAQRADELTTQAQQEEAIELAIASVQAQGSLELDKTKLATALQSQLGDTSYTLIENEDGSFLLQIAERSYYIDSTGEVMAEENMIAIGSTEELKAFRDDVNSGNTYEGKYVYLTNNITLDINEEWEPIGIYQEDSTNPEDETNEPFKGIFDGRFNIISGIYTNSSLKNRGLFGFIKESTIKNIGIINGNINGTSRTGAIVGYAYENSKIINCYNSTNIIVTDNFVGGIVGFAKQNVIIENCYNSGNITGTDNIGGIIGGMENITIRNCYNKGMLNGNSAGGISGIAYESAIIENCYNIGILNATNLALSINNWGNSLVSFKNNYYLENTVNGANDIYEQEECKVKTSQETKHLYTTLGESYKEDINNINNGYPILTWQ